METLEDLSLLCCSSMCCLTIVGMLFLRTFLRRTGRGWRDVAREGGGLFGIDLGIVGDLLGMGGGDGGGRRR